MGLAHSKTCGSSRAGIERFAAWSAVALYRFAAAGEMTPCDRSPARCPVRRGEKAPEDWRTPQPGGSTEHRGTLRVLECGSALPLWKSARALAHSKTCGHPVAGNDACVLGSSPSQPQSGGHRTAHTSTSPKERFASWSRRPRPLPYELKSPRQMESSFRAQVSSLNRPRGFALRLRE
jgi:hypothetical protein